MSESLLRLIIVLPLLSSALIGLIGFLSPSFRKQETLIGIIASAAVGIPFLLILGTFLGFEGTPVGFKLFTWMATSKLEIAFSYTLDPLSLIMGLVVTGVGSLIHIYSIGYMHGDNGYYRYFSFLNLFIFAMLNLILGDNLAVLFLGWEGVGLCSYLLIGFWYQDMMKAKAAQKAFIANRIGDFAMLIAIMLIFTEMVATNGSSSLRFVDIINHDFGDKSFWITLLVFIAATGKSAQIPLYVWLPDAMAGPTPVSALIHAATMVTSGIYLIARLSPVYETPAAEGVLLLVCIVAAITALLAALMAMAQNDIKGVLAYSTVSQLGFMFMALGAGAYTVAIFHVMTHAFFKACLFLGSGSVIHAMEHMHTVKDPQDIRYMGGLGKYMPHTRLTFWIATLAISGIPLLAGFFSKDEILSNVFFSGYENSVYFLIYGVGIFTAFLTAFYMTRLSYLTFEGKSRFPDTKHPHESPAVMTIPLWVLAILAIVGGYVGLPAILGENVHLLNHFLLENHNVVNSHEVEHLMHEHHSMEFFLIPFSALIAIVSLLFAFRMYKKNELAGDKKVAAVFGGMYVWMQNKFYVDELYEKVILRPFVWAGEHIVHQFDQKVIDGFVNGLASVTVSLGETFRKLQTGLVSNYVLVVVLGVLAIMSYLIFG
jgi:NADH-quinone oxidoreductase subunit L